MTHAAWLAARGPDVPAGLRTRVLSLLSAHPALEALPLPEALIEGANLLLRGVLEGDPSSRTTALDLLAADACITYAFEAAADEPEKVGERAEAAMRRIAAVAAEYSDVPRSAAPAHDV